MDCEVVVSFPTREDITEIIRYISLDSPQSAVRFAHLLYSKTKILQTHPEMGRVVPEGKNSTIREIIVKSYRVIYNIDSKKKRVNVLRYWHAARGTPIWN
ncbi:MAG: type II toxin-antitoxin system RelE/ParE family toxin [Chthoniobacterales bacterium]